MLLKISQKNWPTLLKKTPTHVFSCEYCETFKNNYFEEHLRPAASEQFQTLADRK